jgi:hypothetical protein
LCVETRNSSVLPNSGYRDVVAGEGLEEPGGLWTQTAARSVGWRKPAVGPGRRRIRACGIGIKDRDVIDPLVYRAYSGLQRDSG